MTEAESGAAASDPAASDPAAGDFTLWGEADAREWLRVPHVGDDKYSRGVLGVVTGSREYPGAAVLGVEAAARAGAGMVRYLGPKRATQLVLQRRPEVVTTPGRVQAWLIGSGMDASTRTDSARDRLQEVLAQDVPVVVDAGALDLAEQAAGPVVVTPHSRELARMFGLHDIDVAADEIDAVPAMWAARAADEFDVTVLLKGHTTYVAQAGVEPAQVDSAGHGGAPRHPPLRVRVQAGPPWMATAGTGDVLGGVLGTLIATFSREVIADPRLLVPLAATAAYLHGRAGARASGGAPIVAMDVAEFLPITMRDLISGGA